MSYTPTILIVNDPRLHGDLTMMLPPKACRIIHLDTFSEALNYATDAAVVIINARGREAESFSRRLHADPITENLPILVRGTTHQRAPWADEILPADSNQVVNVLQTYLPELQDASLSGVGGVSVPSDFSPDDFEAFDDDTAFDLDESTVIWRRPEGVDDWPQPPPERRSDESILDYTRGYAGYVNSLVEAYASPGNYSSAQHVRIEEMGHRVLGSMDEVLNTIQDAINDSLREGDLQRMRELSAGKNILFEKLQQLRKQVGKISHGVSATGVAPALRSAAPRREGLPLSRGPHTTGPHATPEFSSSASFPSGEDPSLGATGPQRKSRLTLAAEAKEKERALAVRRKIADHREARPSGAARRRNGGEGFFHSHVFWLSLVALIVIVGGVTYLVRLDKGPTKAAGNPNNHFPVMRYVTIQETSSGIVARPRAQDADGDRVNFSLRWSVDGEIVRGAHTARLPKRFYRKGQDIVVEVTPWDKFGRGHPMASQPLTARGYIPSSRRRPRSRSK